MPRLAKKKVAKKAAAPEAVPTNQHLEGDEVVVPAPVVDAPVLPPCGLEDAPPNSKVVVVIQENVPVPLLMTPDGLVALAPDDVARKLPLGARVRKMGERIFAAEQLDPAEGIPPLVTTTAREAMARFNAHFHHVKD